MSEDGLIGLRSSEGAVFRVHKWLLLNTSNVLRELMTSVPEESEIQLPETTAEVLLLLRALYGSSLSPPEGLKLEGDGAITWQAVATMATLADKFDVPRLLKSCANFMATTGIACLESQPSETGLQTAMSWLKLARRLGLESVTQAVAALLGRMFFAWNVKEKLKEVASEMDPATFMEVVSNITENTDNTPPASQPSRTASQEMDTSDQQRSFQVAGPPHGHYHRFHHFGGGPEPLLGYTAHPLHVAAPLVPVSLW